MLDEKRFRFRTKCIWIAGILWALAAAASVFYYTVMARDSLVEESSRIAWRQGVLSPVRGRILSRDGVVLAWTEMYHDLYLTSLPGGLKRREKLLQRLKEEGFSGIEMSDQESLMKHLPYCLKREVAPDEFPAIRKLMTAYPELSLQVRFERKVLDSTEIQSLIGACSVDSDGIFVGISGIESEMNSVLAGESGLYQVMVDRYGNWLEGTLKILMPAEEGLDVTLGKSLSELTERDEKTE